MAHVLPSTPAVPPHHALADTTPSTEQLVLHTLAHAQEDLLLPTPALHTGLRLLAKRYVDPVAERVSAAQQARVRAAGRQKRKRSAAEDEEARSALRLKQVYLDGFSTDQVWEQARIVLAAAAAEAERALHDAGVRASAAVAENGNGAVGALRNGEKSVRFTDEDSGDEHGPVNDGHDAVEPLSGSEDEEEDVMGLSGELEEEIEGEEEEFEEEFEGEDVEEESDLDIGNGRTRARPGTYVKDKHGLNDGFFSIDDFNDNTEFLEGQDAKGDSDDGAASDEEDVDWSVDPLSQPLPRSKDDAGKSRNQRKLESEDGDDGPTFGDADLNAPFDSDSDDDAMMEDGPADEEEGGPNTNDVYYTDFFAPPARPLSKSKSRRPLPKTQPPSDLNGHGLPADDEPTEEDIQRTMKSVRRDIFGSASPSRSPSPSADKRDATAAKGNLSTHERRRAALAQQICELEAAAVAKREWHLAGEARAADRPADSLLDAALDFERAGKPLPPPATAEDSRSFEELVKQRIRERRFDEVVKRRPDPLALAGLTTAQRRGLLGDDVALDAGADGKARPGLADEYEELHTGQAKAARSEATQRAHDEVRTLWADVAKRLDALCSLRYRPAPPALEVRVVTDRPRIEMEDARPGVAEALGAGEESGLAPQEVYRPGGDAGSAKERDVVVTTGGGVVAREEMTREEKRRRRRRAKERLRKSGGAAAGGAPANGESTKPTKGDTNGKAATAQGQGGRQRANERKQILDQLKGAGVKVIGKDGQIKTVEGRTAALGERQGASIQRAGKYKL